MQFGHEPVLLQETIDALALKPGELYVDCTVGAAGHSLGMLATEPTIKLIGIDQDEVALERAKYRLATYARQVTLLKGNFRHLQSLLAEVGVTEAAGILIDLGVSSLQLDEGERGFSYHQDARLDMRMDRSGPLDAWTIVNTYSEEELGKIIWEYGEEKWAARISQFIVAERQRRPIDTTGDLVAVIKKAVPAGARAQGKHPARRTFQALRIAVNDELGALTDVLRQAVALLKPGGRLAVITFHSLEDRLVKDYFQELLGKCTCPPGLPVCVCGRQPVVELVNRKPIVPSPREVETNPRSRSAKLRVVEKL
ncbi:MAG: 16S rRNA (cytosine(1402)-N(4))-methyltransferase RsmH [Limnochordia bacterium]|jgi:16S rRNA (cytosine1402-N4)-methyltransferase|nr:16S rRNA (cytosine(1402)-N(4))-methyltransferase RsmH [Limnochordia bacterium]MDI9465947.1 16S rRNA (cytosine(1402)-N(4))-methyltransferase RsmH [Bacillota bacterium]NLO95321.1 16S rRNA (cytosine(1402)-N(4))-methyltransferase RsmH [Bacillota bacterium]HAI52541.1 16S rRNA (cytosine(1402)-N(4))-methyltransferase [Bacillota bacterium]HOB40511.1 16S rRNA (cytosine(1402)-N(4))-methyltransferase RsmH [Limnochordia bacterium]